MPAIIKWNLFMVFSSHQSFSPVTSAVRISRNVVVAILVSELVFFVKLRECLEWRLLRFTEVCRESVCSVCAIRLWRPRLRGEVCDSVCVCVVIQCAVMCVFSCKRSVASLHHNFSRLVLCVCKCVCVCFARFGWGGGCTLLTFYAKCHPDHTPGTHTNTHIIFIFYLV